MGSWHFTFFINPPAPSTVEYTRSISQHLLIHRFRTMDDIAYINALVKNKYIDRSGGVKAPEFRICESTSNRRQNTNRGAGTATSQKQISPALTRPRELRSERPMELFELDQSGKRARRQESPSSRHQRGEALLVPTSSAFH